MIIQTFNTIYLAVLGFFTIIGTGLCLFIRKQSKESARRILLWIYSLVVLYYFVYKGFLITDEAYCALQEYQRPYFLNELPFNACNVLLFALPIALIFSNEALLSCITFFPLLTAAMAILMPSKGFNGYPFLNPGVMGFYITHYMVALETPLLICSGLYKPKYKDMFKATITLFLFALGAFLISFLLVKTGLNPKANYFFTMDPDGNPILEILWKLIPIQWVYLLPTSVIALLWCALVTLVYNITKQKKK